MGEWIERKDWDTDQIWALTGCHGCIFFSIFLTTDFQVNPSLIINNFFNLHRNEMLKDKNF